GANFRGAGKAFKWDTNKLKCGMTLLFSRDDATTNTPQDNYYYAVFLSQAQLLEIAGGGVLIQMPSLTYGDKKYFYVSTTGISGHADDSNYRAWALRRVTIM
ncbi:hypothetical protein NV44_07015, partial [Listeria monocytogenes]